MPVALPLLVLGFGNLGRTPVVQKGGDGGDAASRSDDAEHEPYGHGYMNLRRRKARTSACVNSEPFAVLATVSEPAMPVVLDSVRIVRLDRVHYVRALGKLDREFIPSPPD